MLAAVIGEVARPLDHLGADPLELRDRAAKMGALALTADAEIGKGGDELLEHVGNVLRLAPDEKRDACDRDRSRLATNQPLGGDLRPGRLGEVAAADIWIRRV